MTSQSHLRGTVIVVFFLQLPIQETCVALRVVEYEPSKHVVVQAPSLCYHTVSTVDLLRGGGPENKAE